MSIKKRTIFWRENYRRVVKSLKEGQTIESLQSDKVNIQFLGVNQNLDTSYVFSDTTELHYYWKRPEPHRMLTKVANLDGQFYKVSMMDVIIESDDVYKGVINILAILFIGLSIALMVFGYLIGKQLLKPFQQTLTSIRTFNVKEDEEIPLVATNTKEFRQLNAFVYSMKDKARRDYQALKEFTENASHEMQTPVAIAKGKTGIIAPVG